MNASVDEYDPKAWIEYAKRKIKEYEEEIEEVEFMVKTDYSRNRYRIDNAIESIMALKSGIIFAEDQIVSNAARKNENAK